MKIMNNSFSQKTYKLANNSSQPSPADIKTYIKN